MAVRELKIGDKVFVKPKAEEKYTIEYDIKRIHNNFFGIVEEIDDGVIGVDFDNDINWYYYAEELCLASEIQRMTLADIESNFGVVVNATYTETN